MKKTALGEKMRKLAAQTRDHSAVRAIGEVSLAHVVGGKPPRP